ncbi:MAG TPA: cupredoxin domain-containing protein [Actinomycetota bacterium]|nr:cupredoxin domain-containing protein [Actinomycetota bacterium]
MRSPVVRLLLLLLCGAVLVAGAVLLTLDPAPYVVTAIDYHFHDAHPTLPIADGRDLLVDNEGRNVHNVTIDALGVSSDVQPGERLTIDDIAARLPPGSYALICRYHEDRGMTGTIVIAG